MKAKDVHAAADGQMKTLAAAVKKLQDKARMWDALPAVCHRMGIDWKQLRDNCESRSK